MGSPQKLSVDIPQKPHAVFRLIDLSRSKHSQATSVVEEVFQATCERQYLIMKMEPNAVEALNLLKKQGCCFQTGEVTFYCPCCIVNRVLTM